METKYQAFLDFDWSDERWQSYLGGLYPLPNHKQILKFKKKWYKKNIDTAFDEIYEPSSSSTSSAPTAGATSSNAPGFSSSAYGDDGRWAGMGSKATFCFTAYAAALAMSIASLFGVLATQQAIMAFIIAFCIELLSKHKFSFSKEWLQTIMQEEVGMMPFACMAALTPGTHRALSIVTVVPPFLAALISFAQICRAHSGLPGFIKRSFSPLAEPSARGQLMQSRADAEVAVGFVLIGGAVTRMASPVSVLLHWNTIMARYMMSPWTQASFRKVDGMLDPVLGKIPGVSSAYGALKRLLYSFVDPQRRAQGGGGCTIL